MCWPLLNKIKKIIDWLPIIWRDEDWDYGFLLDILQFKLLRMSHRFDTQTVKPVIMMAKRARKIREVVEHLKRFRGIDEYHQLDYGEHKLVPIEDRRHLRHVRTGGCTGWQIKHQCRLEQWHWDEAWRKIARYGRSWWD